MQAYSVWWILQNCFHAWHKLLYRNLFFKLNPHYILIGGKMTSRLQVNMSKNRIMFKRALNVHSNRNIINVSLYTFWFECTSKTIFKQMLMTSQWKCFNQPFMQLSSSSHIHSEGKIVLKQTHLESRWWWTPGWSTETNALNISAASAVP